MKKEVESLFKRYKNSAKYRGLNFNIHSDIFEQLIKSNCHYCGASPLKISNSKKPLEYNGIDRLDNNKHYSEGNTVSCCYRCNRAKFQETPLGFDLHMWEITRHQIIRAYGIEVWNNIQKNMIIDEKLKESPIWTILEIVK